MGEYARNVNWSHSESHLTVTPQESGQQEPRYPWPSFKFLTIECKCGEQHMLNHVDGEQSANLWVFACACGRQWFIAYE